jgi:integrase/recombinase XerD
MRYTWRTMKTNALTDQVADYLAETKAKRSPATFEQYESVLENVWLPWCAGAGITSSAQMTDGQMDAFTASLKAKRNRGKPLSPFTLRTYIRSVRIFLTWASVPKGRYEAPRKPGKRLRDVLTRQEIQLMEDTATDARDKLIVRTLADTGMRVGELLTLSKAHGLREDAHARQYWLRVIGKGDRERDIDVLPALYRRLKDFAAHGSPKDCELIFCGKRRRNDQLVPLTRSGVDQLIRNLGKTAGITKRTYPHGFRHAYISHMLSKGANLVQLQDQMGHTSLAMISEAYNQMGIKGRYGQLAGLL